MRWIIRLVIILWLIGLALLYYQPISRERSADNHASIAHEIEPENR